MSNKRLVILSGISGAGKSTAQIAFEEMKFHTIVNLPSYLFANFLDKIDELSGDNIFLQLHLHKVEDFMKELEKHPDISYELILLTADKDTILNRYKFTRHVHPLQVFGSDLDESLNREFEIYENVRDYATSTVDTSNLSVSTLRRYLFKRYRDNQKDGTIVTFLSFGYKYGVPREVDLLFDVRAVPNPYYDEKLQNLTGNNPAVIEYLEKFPITERYKNAMINFIDGYLDDVTRESRPLVTIAIGCTGGQHRSVYFANQLAAYFENKTTVIKIHRDITKR
jgi:UPF0042 nucleotide-binding protein